MWKRFWTGMISGMLTINRVSNDPFFQDLVGGNLTHLLLFQTNGMDYLNKSSTEPATAY